MGENMSQSGEAVGPRHVAELTDADIQFFHELPGGDRILGVAQYGDEGELSLETVVNRFRIITKDLTDKEQKKDD
jgi:hypothetical protein